MESLNLDLAGIEAAPIITCTIEGIVEPTDLAGEVQSRTIAKEQRVLPSGEAITKLRQRHHTVARLIAGGMTQTLVASITRYTEAYLSTLLNNPSMQELINHYAAQNSNAHEAVTEQLRNAGLGALERLEDKLDEDELDANQLLGLAKLGLDRSDHGPSSTNRVVSDSHIFDHAELLRMQRAARNESAEYIESANPALPAPEDKDS